MVDYASDVSQVSDFGLVPWGTALCHASAIAQEIGLVAKFVTSLHCCFPEVLAVYNILADVSSKSYLLDDFVSFTSRRGAIAS